MIKLAHMVLKGVICVHNVKNPKTWFCVFSWKCTHFPSNLHKMHAFSENARILTENARKCAHFHERPLPGRVIVSLYLNLLRSSDHHLACVLLLSLPQSRSNRILGQVQYFIRHNLVHFGALPFRHNTWRLTIWLARFHIWFYPLEIPCYHCGQR